jgi:hypothetical protein
MFFPGSRYASLGRYSIVLANGTTVSATKLPTPGLQVALGYYRRSAADRLDQIAARFLADPTAFWRVCDANGAMVPDALAASDLVGVPIDAPVGG